MSGNTEILSKIVRLNPQIVSKIGEVFNNFSRFTLLGRSVNAVMCVQCNEIDANFGKQDDMNLKEYKAHLHKCVSPQRRLHQVKVIKNLCTLYLKR